jgi:hypothetical protein
VRLQVVCAQADSCAAANANSVGTQFCEIRDAPRAKRDEYMCTHFKVLDIYVVCSAKFLYYVG